MDGKRVGKHESTLLCKAMTYFVQKFISHVCEFLYFLGVCLCTFIYVCVLRFHTSNIF